MNKTAGKIKAKKITTPPKCEVVLLNDNVTTMDFVVMILERFFHKTTEEAIAVMLRVHHRGEAVCGRYTPDIAETIVEEVKMCAMVYHFPLACEVRETHLS